MSIVVALAVFAAIILFFVLRDGPPSSADIGDVIFTLFIALVIAGIAGTLTAAIVH